MLLIIVGDMWYLGVEVGIIMVLYMWGFVMMYYFYVYCIVFGGGLDKVK